jgi:hypothetical protein
MKIYLDGPDPHATNVKMSSGSKSTHNVSAYENIGSHWSTSRSTIRSRSEWEVIYIRIVQHHNRYIKDFIWIKAKTYLKQLHSIGYTDVLPVSRTFLQCQSPHNFEETSAILRVDSKGDIDGVD